MVLLEIILTVFFMNCSLTSIVAGEMPACSQRACRWHTRKSLWSLISLVAKVKYHSGCDEGTTVNAFGQKGKSRREELGLGLALSSLLVGWFDRKWNSKRWYTWSISRSTGEQGALMESLWVLRGKECHEKKRMEQRGGWSPTVGRDGGKAGRDRRSERGDDRQCGSSGMSVIEKEGQRRCRDRGEV